MKYRLFATSAVFAALFSLPVAASAAGTCTDGFDSAKYADLKGKVITAAVDPTEPPMIFRDKDHPDQITGFHADLLEDIAACLGATVEFQPLAFDGIIPAVSAGRVDLEWTGMYYRAERAKVVDFVVYMKSATGAVTQAAKASTVTSVDAFCGLRGAVLTGAVDQAMMQAQSDKCVAAGGKPIEISTYENTAAIVRAIENDRADVALFEVLAAKGIVAANPKLAMPFSVSTGLLVGGATRKNNEPFRDAIAAALTHLQGSGDTARLMAKWGLDPVIEEPVSVKTE
jgi:polar amino acid transport system substrate-binding protein